MGLEGVRFKEWVWIIRNTNKVGTASDENPQKATGGDKKMEIGALN